MAQADRRAMVCAARVRTTVANVNAGATLLASVKGMAHRLVDFTLIAVGGAAGAATSVDIIGTRSGVTVRLAVVAIAALSQGTAVKPNSANVTLLADGASFTPLDENTPITIGKQSGGADLTTATHFDVILSTASEKA